mmetsp:Transcript_42524/g.100922  ORF Transcript_42524/g.100922 Transcript_42524/m.100922 type:complete len:259 (+) Transcript_42524:1027-1803(+)
MELPHPIPGEGQPRDHAGLGGPPRGRPPRVLRAGGMLLGDAAGPRRPLGGCVRGEHPGGRRRLAPDLLLEGNPPRRPQLREHQPVQLQTVPLCPAGQAPDHPQPPDGAGRAGDAVHPGLQRAPPCPGEQRGAAAPFPRGLGVLGVPLRRVHDPPRRPRRLGRSAGAARGVVVQRQQRVPELRLADGGQRGRRGRRGGAGRGPQQEPGYARGLHPLCGEPVRPWRRGGGGPPRRKRCRAAAPAGPPPGWSRSPLSGRGH